MVVYVSSSLSVTEPQSGDRAPGRERRAERRPLWSRRWPWVVVGVLAVSTLFVIVSDMRPSYDGFGLLVWGRQVLHWNLNTDGAPSWKPLPFLFTLPYAVAGRSQMWLWMITAVAGAVAGSVFAARVAYRLTGPSPQRRYAPFVAGAFAGVAVLGINTYSHLVLIANSDPLIVAVCLAAIDCHLCRRPRLAFACSCWLPWGARRHGCSPVCTGCGRSGGSPHRRCGCWSWPACCSSPPSGSRSPRSRPTAGSSPVTWRSISRRSSTATRSSGW